MAIEAEAALLNLGMVEANGLFFQGGQSPLKYFRECLNVSTSYKRAAGYFSSSMFVAADVAMSGFVERGGSIKLICSPHLLDSDLEAIRSGSDARTIWDEAVQREVSETLRNLSTVSATKLLGCLIANGQLELRISMKRDISKGIFHTKVGIFEDYLNGRSAFCGSTNETWSGWSDYGNSESFLAKSTYRGRESIADVDEIERYFDKLWWNQMENLSTVPFPEVSTQTLIDASRDSDMFELISDLRKVTNATSILASNSGQKNKILMDHQSDVLRNWESNEHIGIISHVTGAGKTITAISAIRKWIVQGDPALVIVPSSLLQKQWADEIRSELGLEALTVGGELGSKPKWMLALADATRNFRDFGPRVTIAVLASASSEDFIKRLKAGKHLLVVGDEVHTMGQMQSRELLRKLSNCGGRLGLSATYERFGDPEGTKKIESTFGLPLEPLFTIRDAIDAGRLVPYDYHIEPCRLDEQESQEYASLSKQIETSMAREKAPDFSGFSKYLQMLIFKRAKVIKQAKSKTTLARRVLQENYHQGDRWLIYCDDTNQMAEVAEVLKSLKLEVLKYYSDMPSDKSATLKYFSEKGGVLLAIKCLDEGIDIPSATHALILASSQNPREYIQRRGRVLRSHQASGKWHAVIFDPVTLTDDEIPVQVSELRRMMSFASDADNSEVISEIDDLLSQVFLLTGEFPEFAWEVPEELEN